MRTEGERASLSLLPQNLAYLLCELIPQFGGLHPTRSSDVVVNFHSKYCRVVNTIQVGEILSLHNLAIIKLKKKY